MSASLRRKTINGLDLCADPAREACFRVVQLDSEMATFEDPQSPESRREKLHRHMNNEIGSLEIAAQCLADFPEASWDLRMELARQANDETRHVEGLHRRLQELGGHKGEFPIANFEWSVTNMQDSLIGRLAIQNRTFEAGQMDLLGTLHKVWRAAGDEPTARLLEAILADEVNHVRFANRWIRQTVAIDKRQLLKVAVAIRFLAEANARVTQEQADGLFRDHAAMGINVEDRLNAEFTQEEVGEILRQHGMTALAEIAERA